MAVDWWAVESFLVGECGISPRMAAEVSFREYVQRREGKAKELRDKWELARWMKWQDMLLSPNVPQGKKPRTPQAFCRFPWDEPAPTFSREDCHISAKTLAWLDALKEKYYNKTN